MMSANSLFEILELTQQIPIAYASLPWRVHLNALAVRAVAIGTENIQLCTMGDVSIDRSWRRRIRQRPDIGDNVIDDGIVHQG